MLQCSRFCLTLCFVYYSTILFILLHSMWAESRDRKETVDGLARGWRDGSIWGDIWWLQSKKFHQYHEQDREIY